MNNIDVRSSESSQRRNENRKQTKTNVTTENFVSEDALTVNNNIHDNTIRKITINTIRKKMSYNNKFFKKSKWLFQFSIIIRVLRLLSILFLKSQLLGSALHFT